MSRSGWRGGARIARFCCGRDRPTHRPRGCTSASRCPGHASRPAPPPLLPTQRSGEAIEASPFGCCTKTRQTRGTRGDSLSFGAMKPPPPHSVVACTLTLTTPSASRICSISTRHAAIRPPMLRPSGAAWASHKEPCGAVPLHTFSPAWVVKDGRCCMSEKRGTAMRQKKTHAQSGTRPSCCRPLWHSSWGTQCRTDERNCSIRPPAVANLPWCM